MQGSLKWAEVAPALPLLPALGEVGAYFLAWGILTLVVLWVALLVYVIQQTAGRIPGIGSVISAGARRLEQYTSSKLSGPIASLDHRMGQAWFRLAGLTKWMAHEIMANAGVLLDLTKLLLNPLSIPAWRAVIGDAHTAIQGVRSSINGKVATVTQPITARIARLEHWTHAQILVLQHAIAGTVIPNINRLRHRNTALGRQYIELFRLIHKINARFATAAFAGLVAVALGSLGLGWVRCRAVGRVGRHICGLGPQLIEDLLAVGLEVVIVADICQIANAIESAAILMEPELDKLVGLSDYLCRAGGASYPSAMVDSDRKGNGGNPSALVAADLAA